MKTIVCLGLLATILGAAMANPTNQQLNAESKSVKADSTDSDLTRLRKSTFNGGDNPNQSPPSSGVPAPPCPKNYMFSCQPNLVPVPCSAAPSRSWPMTPHGFAHFPSHLQGAYSSYEPTYVAPYGYNNAASQAYNGFAPQSLNHY